MVYTVKISIILLIFNISLCAMTLNQAAEIGNEVKITELLEKGDDPKAYDREGRSPLHAAAHNGHSGSVLLLLSRPVDINIRTRQPADLLPNVVYGKTVLHVAVEDDQLEVARDLLRFDGIEVDALDNSDSTPLHAAFRFCISNFSIPSNAMAELLLTHGAGVNRQNKEGKTPLHYAGAYACCLKEELLLRYGARIDIKDTDGYTPTHYASRSIQADKVKTLLTGATFSSGRTEAAQEESHKRRYAFLCALRKLSQQDQRYNLPQELKIIILMHAQDGNKPMFLRHLAWIESKDGLPLLFSQYPHEWLKGAKKRISDDALVQALTNFRLEQGWHVFFEEQNNEGKTSFDLAPADIKAETSTFEHEVRLAIQKNVQKELGLAS